MRPPSSAFSRAAFIDTAPSKTMLAPQNAGLNSWSVKVRITRDSFRFRLTRSEVRAVHLKGSWQERVSLTVGNDSAFAYRVETSGRAAPSLRFTSGPTTIVTVVLPRDAVAKWATSSEVGIYFTETWGLHCAVEKDFRCLDEEKDVENQDKYDNPKANCVQPR